MADPGTTLPGVWLLPPDKLLAPALLDQEAVHGDRFWVELPNPLPGRQLVCYWVGSFLLRARLPM